MSQKKKSTRTQGSVVGSLLAVVIVVIAAIVYALTGVDFLGLTESTQAPPTPINTTNVVPAGEYEIVEFEQGIGAIGSFWQIYFTEPSNTRDRSQYRNGVDAAVAEAIDAVQNTLDIAAFEMNNEAITEAILRAHERGVQVRIVTDDEHGIEDDDTTLVDLELADIPIVNDDRGALMHNKFMIMDGLTVWSGSMNYTVNGVYRNNNNAIALRSRRAVDAYQAEFNEMFERGEFGPRSSTGNNVVFSQDGTSIAILFASEDNVVGQILSEISGARNNIRFMAFSFTRDDIGDALLNKAANGVDVQGVFENTGSETQFSEMPRLLCAGLDVRQDGNSGIMHHKVFIIDNQIVLTGSFNFSNNAVESNDENLLVIRNPDIAALYLQEFERVQSIASPSDDVTCN